MDSLVKIIFVCHNIESINFVRNNNKCNYCIFFVGSEIAPSEILNDPNIIIANTLLNNIENEPKLLTFTVWYCIIKNNLFNEYQYICIFEWDVYSRKSNSWR